MGGVAVFGCVWYCVRAKWLFFSARQVGGLARCAPDELSSESGFKFLFYTRMHGKYTDSCHSIFSKIVLHHVYVTQEGRSLWRPARWCLLWVSHILDM